MSYYPMLKYAGSGGGGSSDLYGNATESDVKSGQTFYSNDATNKQTGSMTTAVAQESLAPGQSSSTYSHTALVNNSYIKGLPLENYTPGTATKYSIQSGYTAWARGKYIRGVNTGNDKINSDGSNTPSELSFPVSTFRIKDFQTTETNFEVNDYLQVLTRGMRYWKKGIVDGTLVADSSHKIYLPRGCVFIMNLIAHNNTNGKYIGSRTYTITTQGGLTSTTAMAVPKVTSLTNAGEPCKLTLGADSSAPNIILRKPYLTPQSGPIRKGFEMEVLDKTTDRQYIGYIIIGSCGTACRVAYEITPLLTPIDGFVY